MEECKPQTRDIFPEYGIKTLLIQTSVWSNVLTCISMYFWNFFGRRDPNDLLSRFVTMEETWLYHYDPETKQQLMEWPHSDSPRPKKFRVQKSAGKFLASIFWDRHDIILIYYLPKGQTINAEYYSSLLVSLKDF